MCAMSSVMGVGGWGEREIVCVCVCVCVRERGRERECVCACEKENVYGLVCTAPRLLPRVSAPPPPPPVPGVENP